MTFISWWEAMFWALLAFVLGVLTGMFICGIDASIKQQAAQEEKFRKHI